MADKLANIAMDSRGSKQDEATNLTYCDQHYPGVARYYRNWAANAMVQTALHNINEPIASHA